MHLEMAKGIHIGSSSQPYFCFMEKDIMSYLYVAL